MHRLSFISGLLLLCSCLANDTVKTSSSVQAPVISLHAGQARIHGSTVRYEPEPHKNTIGYWTKVEDQVSWKFQVPHAGSYQVEILQGCGKGSGGSQVDFSLGEQVLKVTVEDTGHFQSFVNRKIGRFNIPKAGEYELFVKPQTKPGVAVMDLRQVTLTLMP